MKNNKIYDLMYSPLITPANLLDNINLDNYSYINYYKKDDFIIAQIKCICIGDNVPTIFCYYFDKNNFLIKIIKEDINKNKVKVFDRQLELKKEQRKLPLSYEWIEEA